VDIQQVTAAAYPKEVEDEYLNGLLLSQLLGKVNEAERSIVERHLDGQPVELALLQWALHRVALNTDATRACPVCNRVLPASSYGWTQWAKLDRRSRRLLCLACEPPSVRHRRSSMEKKVIQPFTSSAL
jgi:hypothetical protein